MGHDLVLAISEWRGNLVVGQPEATIDVDLRSLIDLGGTGGVTPVDAEDRRTFTRSAARMSGVLAFAVARFTGQGPASLEQGG